MSGIVDLSKVSPKVLEAEYAVRGPIVTRAMELDALLKKDPQRKKEAKDVPFTELIYCNIGNPQQLQQQPLTWIRQICALLQYPALMDNSSTASAFRKDAIQRARDLLGDMVSVGAYTASQGVPLVRKHVAEFIAERDGHPADPNDIFLVEGASQAVCHILELLISERSHGVLCPIPQYPLYSGRVALYGGSLCGYYLKEDREWAAGLPELRQAYDTAVSNGISPRVLVVINPGNPTGQVLDVAIIRDMIKFAAEKNLVLLADEVYQTNVYVDTPFTSFKKVMRDMGVRDLPLVSLHSVSKGFIGECGQRGGYMEAVNFHPDVRNQLLKLASISLCPNAMGQACVDAMVRPPRKGDESYDTYVKETTAIYQSLKKRALQLAATLNALPGMSCNQPQGAMYIFAKVDLPPKAVAEAERRKVAPDFLYAAEMLEKTGIVVVPGSGFGQAPNTHHFRTTFLPPPDKIDSVSKILGNFHNDFMKKYS